MEATCTSLQKLDNPVVLDLLANAALNHPEVNSSIQAAIDAKRREELGRVLDFDILSKTVWYEINIEHKRLRDSKQYEMAGEVYGVVAHAIERIQKDCGIFANAQTRYNGLSVLRKIGKTICLSGDGSTIGREVRKDFQRVSLLETAMLQIVQGMENEEKSDIRADEGTDESLWPKLLELQKLADDYCVMEGLQGVLDALDEGYYKGFYKPSRRLASDGEDHEIERAARRESRVQARNRLRSLRGEQALLSTSD